jgi:predicted O-linked N-acetylglucosamine transferase (SPINDLY family)
MEALAMGVPVVTLAGVRHGERLGNALLRRFGVVDTIAHTEDEYVAFARRLADDRAWSGDLRERIRAAARSSPVWNGEDRTRGLEAAIVGMVANERPAQSAA